MEETPAALGYRMPAEWEPHAATWLSWPRREGISFPDAFDRVLPTFRAMVAALIASEPVCINVCNGAHEAEAREVLRGLPNECITYYEIPTNEPWCRDHGPIFLTRNEDPKLAIVDWGHNAWGGKYPPFDLDDVVPTRIGQALGLPVYDGGMILEGGSIDVNGAGACLTTESCLLNPNRNPNLSREQIEQHMRDFLGLREIFWLSRGTEGDDTDGHIDNLARFVDERTVLAIVDPDPQSANYEALQENLTRLRETKFKIVELPVPPRMEREDLVLPASYANFYIANERVLVPTYADANDKIAIDKIQCAFPRRKVAPIDCRELIWGLGAFHCLTQQQPA
ncbi:MAG: agmatine deiminase family protein [Verrucomicrobiota bacterium]|nr:agmatine deiminase family protein [Verrucomicrobiota bacterium]